MPTATTTAPAGPSAAQLDDVIDAMRSINSEEDRWSLADALLVTNPPGTNDFDQVVEKAMAAGVLGNLSANTLRLYRDSAKNWPKAKRIAGVSFSAHREVEKLPTIDAGVKLLEAVVKTVGGADKVTVAAVRKAVAIQQGKPAPTTPAARAAASAAATTLADVLTDIRSGGQKLIQSIPGTTPSNELDELHSGLSKVLAHVEKLRAKASQKASAAKKGSGPAVAAPAAPVATPAAKADGEAEVVAGDLRDL